MVSSGNRFAKLERGGGSTSACGSRRAPIKPHNEPSEPPMTGIAVIVVFILVIAVLNRVEFGRFD
jgi:ribose/xylose/arabinose/galactoside ABC-type transport system permease subunit